MLRARTGLRGEATAGEAGLLERGNSEPRVAGNEKERAGVNVAIREAMMRRSAALSVSSSKPLTTLTARFGSENDLRVSPPPGSGGRFGVGCLRKSASQRRTDSESTPTHARGIRTVIVRPLTATP